MKLSDAIVEALCIIDVRHVFGVSGANIEHLHDAIHRLGSDRLTSVMAKSETGAAFMADGYARVHRRLGVCCSTSGGGMMNLAVGIAESHAESVPVLALVGQAPTRGEGRGAFQDSSGIGRTVDAESLFTGIAKFVAKIVDATEFWSTFERAAVAAQSGRQGPAVLLFPRSIWDADVEPPPTGLADRISAATRPVGIDLLGPDPDTGRDAPNDGGVRPDIAVRAGVPPDAATTRRAMCAMLRELRSARCPVLVVGQGLRRCSDPSVVLEFAHALGLPMVTDMSARGEVPNDDPLYLGMLGVAGHPSAHRYLRDHADVVAVVGSGLNSMTRGPLVGDTHDIGEKTIMAVNVDIGELNRAVQPHDPELDRSWWAGSPLRFRVAVEADAGVVFAELLRLWRDDPFTVAAPEPHRLTTFRPTPAPPVPAVVPALEGTLLQSEALELLQRVLPRDGHILYDAGNCAAAALHQLQVPPGASATIALGMGGMGYAISAAVGVALGSTPDQRTVVLAGDGALLMEGFEIHTAVELNLPILFVVFNNAMHGMCVTRQQTFFEGRLECVRYSPIDVAAVARGLADSDRLWVGRATTRAELLDALKEYVTHAFRPGVLELVLAQEEIPPFTPLLPRDHDTMDRPPNWEWN